MQVKKNLLGNVGSMEYCSPLWVHKQNSSYLPRAEVEHPNDISPHAVHWHNCCVPALGHTGVVTCLSRQDNETQIAFCAVLALKAVSLQSIAYSLISTELVSFTVEKATGSRLDSVPYTKGLNKSPSKPSRTAPGEYAARHFIKCFPGRIFWR